MFMFIDITGITIISIIRNAYDLDKLTIQKVTSEHEIELLPVTTDLLLKLTLANSIPTSVT